MDMDLEISPPRTRLSPPNCDSDPEEKEISDDDDDDRNHKHRRRDTMSHSLDRDVIEQNLTQPYRKGNRPFENGLSDPQSHYSSDRDFSRFEKRRPTGVCFSRFSGEQGSGKGRGRGRDYQHDSRFGSVDVFPQFSHPGSISSAMFSGRGLSHVSNAQNWSGFGLIPAVPNDAINPLGFPGILRPQLNPSLNMGIQRQCCRDFEERGFCLRGDMCPMEHGLNRIVVEDVQGLSQFNLPVPMASGHIMGSSGGSGFVPSVGASSSPLINGRGLNNITNKSTANDALKLDGTFSGAMSPNGGDVYDPDQPLWTNGGHEASTLLGMPPPNFYEPEALLDPDLSDRIIRNSGAAAGLQSTSSAVLARLHNSKHKLGLKEKFASSTKPSEYPESRSREFCEEPGSTQGTSPHLGKKNNGVAVGPTSGSTSKLHSDIGCSVRKPTQKAQRTLFVNGIPAKDNKNENLLSHFRKFGEVIDIYIPSNSERAFVQFSKREEAERALKSPDAVMGSRFIKLWRANRDSIADDGMSRGNNGSVTPRDGPAAFASPHPALINKEKNNLPYPASKVAVRNIPDSVATAGSDCKPVTPNDRKAPLLVQKMESLELLKEELRKKQEMLEQKRSEFRRQLDKLAKQATGDKNELPTELAAKRQKVETSTNIAKAGNTQSACAITLRSSSQPEVSTEKTENVESIACQRSKTKDPQSLKQTLCPAATSGTPFHNRYKLDNRPKSFKINVPLPAGLASVAALRDHFSSFGEIANVQLEELGEEDTPNASKSEVTKDCYARISFTARHSAERAFENGKSWHGHNLHFVWVTPSIPCGSRSSGKSSSALRSALNAEVQSADKTRHTNSLEVLGPIESNSSLPKPLNEVSCDSSRSSGRGNFPVGEEHSVFEAESLHKSGNYVPLEAEEPESKDLEVPEEIAG